MAPKDKIKAETDYWLGVMHSYGVEPDRIRIFGEKMRALLQEL